MVTFVTRALKVNENSNMKQNSKLKSDFLALVYYFWRIFQLKELRVDHGLISSGFSFTAVLFCYQGRRNFENSFKESPLSIPPLIRLCSWFKFWMCGNIYVKCWLYFSVFKCRIKRLEVMRNCLIFFSFMSKIWLLFFFFSSKFSVVESPWHP